MDGLEKYRAAGQRAGLIMAVAGTATAVAMLALIGLVREFGENTEATIVMAMGIATTVGLGWSQGGVFGVRVARGGNPWLLGVALALTTVVGTVLILSAALAVLVGLADHSLKAHLVVTLVWLWYVLMFGGLPLVALGLGYGAMLRKVRGAAGGAA